MPYKKEEVDKKLSSIEFRGPDNTGFLKVKDVTMGHLRLSVLDLDERSNQPMKFEEYYIVYNGEVYNFLSVKDELLKLGYKFHTSSDTEILLVAYKHWGSDILQKINGMFAFAIYDSSSHKIFCARDRLGVKPFYYFWRDGSFEICSQLRPLINSNSKISEEAVSIYLDCGYVPSPFSIIEDIFKLPPGNFMEIDLKNRTKSLQEYWNLKPVSIGNLSYEEAKNELHGLLIDAVKIRLQSDVPLGSFLSGGIDSALVSSIASKISKEPINTFTIGFEDPGFDESKIAEQFAKIIQSNHTETFCTPKEIMELIPKLVQVYDEPFADSSALPSLLLNSVTKKYVTVALSGDGGDESFFGYNHFDSVRKFIKINRIPPQIRYLISKFLTFKFLGTKTKHLKTILQVKSLSKFIYSIFIGYDSLQRVRNERWLTKYEKYLSLSANPLQKAADINIKLWLENDSNVKVDRASMAYSVEVRSPFLDYRIIEFARMLPVAYRYQKGLRKKILRDLLKNYIPESIFNQPKKGFSVPLNKWIREDLRDNVLNELNDHFLKKVPNLDVEKFKSQLNCHMKGTSDYSFNIWKLYILSKWYKEFGFKGN
ncbi:MAG: asparagine synthase (glutamine-hydrolyzing) [Ginsengibacter sp.]